MIPFTTSILQGGPRPYLRRLACLCWLLSGLLVARLAQAQGAAPAHAPGTAKPAGSTTSHQLLLCTNGQVMGIGTNTYGELANGTAVGGTTSSFTYLSMPTTMVRVAAVSAASFGIDTNGNLWSWGNNSDGMLGLGSGVAATATPTQVPGISHVVAVSGGFRFVVALCSDGTVWSWGNQTDGALGNGNTSTTTVYTPQQLPASAFQDAPIRSVVSGDQFTLALDSGGRIWSWGIQNAGELGLSATVLSNPVQAVPARLYLKYVQQIDATNGRAAAVSTSGEVYVWGRNSFGELGLNHTNYVGIPTQVPGLLPIASVALGIGATIAVMPTGGTYVWGDNSKGQLAVTFPSFAPTPIAGPGFSEGVQVTGSWALFTSIERTGVVKTWGEGYLGYTPSSPSPAGGGSYFPTTPNGVCLSVPASGFPGCGPLRAFYQQPNATYIASNHGYSVSPAEIGQPGVLTTIDVSQAPYNGNLTLSGVYHVLGDVKFINGTVDITPLSTLWIDGPGGTYSDYRLVSIQVENATLQLRGATLRAHCDELWGGVLLLSNGILRSSATRAGFLTLGSTVRDSFWGVWASAPSSHYTLSRTTFLNNSGAISDGGRSNIQAGEGVTNCTFRIDAGAGGPLATSVLGLYNSSGISFADATYSTTSSFGDYGQATFSNNTFEGLRVGVSGTAGNAQFTTNTFTNCWYAAAASSSIPNVNGQPTALPMVFANNTVNIPTAFPAAYTTSPNVTAYGIIARLDHVSTGNTFQLAPATSGVASRRVGVSFYYGGTVEKNRFTGLDVGIEAVSGDWYSDYLHGNSSTSTSGLTYTFASNTFTYPSTTAEGISFLKAGYSYGRFAPVTITCNSFDGSTGTSAASTGIWVKSGTVFPAQLSNPGNSSGANGNNVGSLTATKRFVYEGTLNNFTYRRYNSSQETFGGASGDELSNLAGNAVTATATNTGVAGTNACGTASGPGVNARAVAAATQPTAQQAGLSTPLSAAYPNPATETVTFAYALQAGEAVLVLRNLLGQAAVRQPLAGHQGEITISVHALPAGFYTATLELNGHAQQVQKLTIAH